MRQSGKRSSGASRNVVLGAIAAVAGAWLVIPKALATDPDGVSTPTFSGAPSGTPYAWAGTSPKDGFGVMVNDGRMRHAFDVAQCSGVMIPFFLHVSYDSMSDYDGYEGRGWFSLLDTTVAVNSSGDVTILMEDGVARTWTKSGSTYIAPSGVIDVLTKNCSTSTYTRTCSDGFQFIYGTKLDSMKDRFGNTISFAYDGSGNPTSITDTRGQTHTIGLWSGTGRLHTITTADGRCWTFQYDTYANLVEVDGPTTASFSSGIVHRYEYFTGAATDALMHDMTAVIDGRGDYWLMVAYDASDRVTSQSVDGNSIAFDYSEASSHKTKVTDRNGNIRIWEWDADTLARKSLLVKTNREVRSGEGNYTTTWGSDGVGYVTSVTMPRGNGIKWTLNAAKLPTEARRKTDMSAADSSTDDLVDGWVYDSASYYTVVTATDAEGNPVTYAYDSLGRHTGASSPPVTTGSTPVTITKAWTYNSNGTIASETDGEGKVTLYEYYTSGPRLGRLHSVSRDPGGLSAVTAVTMFDYNDFGALTSATDPRGNTTTFVVEAYGNVTEIDAPSPLGYVKRLEYDGNLNVTRTKTKNLDETGAWSSGPEWWETTYTYTTMDRLASMTEYVTASHNRVTTCAYDHNDNLTQISRDKTTVQYVYDERDLVYQRVGDPGDIAAVESFDYDENGNVAHTVDPRGKTWSNAYDLFDRRTCATDPLSHHQDFVYDKRGHVVEQKWYQHGSSSDTLLAHQKTAFDEVGRPWQEQDLLKGTTDQWLTRTQEFDKRGLVTTATDRRGYSTTYAYDGLGRVSSVTDAAGTIQACSRDPNGNVTDTTVTVAVPGSSSTETYATSAVYDAANRMTTQTVVDRTNSSNTKVTSWALDSRSLARSVTNPMGNVMTAVYDGLGRTTQRVSPITSSTNSTVQYAYDDNNNVTAVTDSNSHSTTFAYDNLNRATTATYADSSAATRAYDAAGNVSAWTDQNGTTVSQAYDDAGRLTARTATLGTGVNGITGESFTYDGMGRLIAAYNDSSTVAYSYDSLSRVTNEVEGAYPIGSTGKTVGYEYNEESALTRVLYPAGYVAERSRDPVDRTTVIKDASNASVVSYSYFGSGDRVAQTTFGDGTHTDYTYDGFARPATVNTFNSSNAPLEGYSYGYDKNNNVLFEARSHQSGHGDAYFYDKSDRMTKAVLGSVDPAAEVASPGSTTYSTKVEFNLDGEFNRTSVVSTPFVGGASTTSYTVNNIDEYTAIGGQSYSYFANGDLKDDGSKTYTYDFHNRLVEVRQKSDNSVIASYQYDAVGNGRRWLATANGQTVRYVFDPGLAIEEYDYETGDLLRSVVFGNCDDPVAIDDGSHKYYLHKKADGSITHVTDGSQNVVESYEYGPNGETTIRDASGTVVASTQIGSSYGFRGMRLDSETGLYLCYDESSYSPTLGASLQPARATFGGPDTLTYCEWSDPYEFWRRWFWFWWWWPLTPPGEGSGGGGGSGSGSGGGGGGATPPGTPPVTPPIKPPGKDPPPTTPRGREIADFIDRPAGKIEDVGRDFVAGNVDGPKPADGLGLSPNGGNFSPYAANMPSNCLGSLGGPSDLQLAAQAAQGPAQSSADAPSADTRNPFQKAMDAISDVANSANQFLYKATVTEPARMLDAAGNAVKDALHNDIVQDSLAIGMVALSGFKEDEGAARSQVQGLVEEASPNVGSQVYRLFGDASDLGANGGSWTTQNPAMMSNARDTLGLPASNSAEFLATGRIADMAGAIVRAALSLDGNRGGGVEVKGAKVLVETVHSFGQ